MPEKIIKFVLFLFLAMQGCNKTPKPTATPLWVLKTTYPIVAILDLDNEFIAASCLDGFLLIKKGSVNFTRHIPITGRAPGGIWVDGHYLYYGSADHFFRCYDIDRQTLQWEYPTLLPNEALPVTDEHNMYGGSRDHTLYAIDKFSGVLKWKFQTQGPIYAQPLLCDSLLIIGSWDTRLYALLRKTGKKVWEFTAQSGVDQMPLVIGHTLWFSNYDYHVYGVDLRTGELKNHFSATNAFEFNGALWQHTLIFSGIDRRLYFLDLLTGQMQVKGTLPIAISTSPLVLDHGLFTGHYDGSLNCWQLPAMSRTRLYCFNDRVIALSSDGQFLWASSADQTLARFPLDDVIFNK